MDRSRVVSLLAALTASAALCAIVAPAAAQAEPTSADHDERLATEHAAPSIETPRKWKLKVEPAVWFVAPGGDITLPTLSDVTTTSIGPGDVGEINLSDLELDRPEASPSGEIHLCYGDWRFCLRGFSSSTDADTRATGAGSINGLPFGTDDRIASSLDFLAAEAEVGYTLHRNTPRKSAAGHDILRSTVEVVGGVRIYDVDWEISNATTGGESLHASESFVEPLVGGRLALDFYDQFSLDVQLTAGGLPLDGDSTFSVDVIAGFSWRPVNHFAVQIGYRQLLFNLQSGDASEKFEYDGALAGLYGGIALDF